ncbi:MAG: hypothetical protein QM817_25535 [Archangium sp.]
MTDDDQNELQRLERDLAAIDARWSTEGYQQRTSSRVLDDERKTRTELQLRIMKLESSLKSSAATPALGTGSVRANVGMAWEPLALFDGPPEADDNELPVPAFDVAGTKPSGLNLDELRAELWAELQQLRSHERLLLLLKRWAAVPEARRLLGAAFQSIGSPRLAMTLSPAPLAWTEKLETTVTSRFLTGSNESVDPVTGLTATQRRVLELLCEVAPANGPFVDLASLVVEAKRAGVLNTDAEFTDVAVAIGHPSLRPYPLLEFRGFRGRFSEEPSFTHARMTALGADVLNGSFALPNLLINGAVGEQVCVFPFRWSDVALLVRRMLEGEDHRLWFMATSLTNFEFPDRALPTPVPAFDPKKAKNWKKWRKRLWKAKEAAKKEDVVIEAYARVTVERRGESQGRVVIDCIPWPLRASAIQHSLERARVAGALDGVTRIVDESSADAQRLVLDLEHVLFGEPTRLFIERTGAVRAVYARWPPELRATVFEERRQWLLRVARAFIDSRFERARRLLADDPGLQRVAECEAICVALAMVERVQQVIRDADDDAHAAVLLTRCIRLEDKAALTQPFPLTHAYAEGFTLRQAQFLVRQRRLAHRPVEAARTDWARALDALGDARRTVNDEAALRRRVLEEVHGLSERFTALRAR